MNSVLGIVDLSKTNGQIVSQHDFFNNGKLSLEISRNHVFKYSSDNYFYNPTDNCLIAILGYFTNINEIKSELGINESQDVKSLYSIYEKFGAGVLDKLDGIFLILFFDFNKLKFNVLQSSLGMNLPFYYFMEGNKLYFSTSLKMILPYKSSRIFNKHAAQDFIFYEMIIPNESTLIEGINKFIPKQILDFNLGNGSLNIINHIGKENKIIKDTAKKILIQTIEKPLLNISKNLIDGIALTHTSGWDSNFMLYFLNKLHSTNIRAVTICGGQNYDEVTTVREILSRFYENIHLYTSDVTTNVMHFPHIVWLYEGYVFQEGIFLRYELSKLLSKNKIDTIFLGATADQMLYPPTKLKRLARNLKENSLITHIKTIYRYFSHKNRLPTKAVPRKSLQRTSINRNYDNIQIDMLLKMHEIPLNSYNISGLYPFLNKETFEASTILGKMNKRKKYYIKQVRAILGDEIAGYLAKSHKTVDTLNIFNVNRDYLIQKYIQHKDFILSFIDIKTYKRILKFPDDNHLLIMHCIYLIVFNILFISKEFDNKFKNNVINLTFNDLQTF